VADLEDSIIEELENNPTLEQEESKLDQDSELDTDGKDEVDWDEEMDDYEPGYTAPRKEESLDLPLPDRPDFIAGLIKQIELLGMGTEELEIAKDIIWNLDERGYLSTDLELLADRFEISKSDLDHTLNKIYMLEPKGLGARNLRECLLLQLNNKTGSLAHQILSDHFDDFANHRYEIIEKSLSCSKEDLSTAIGQISSLNPKPGEAQQITKDETVIPDVILTKRDDEWFVTTNDNWIPELRINSTYKLMAKQNSQNAEAKRFIQKKINSAEWFIDALHQRRKTLINVSTAILLRQPEFFKGNINSISPMKLQDIADDISMDVSTISRATRGKYADTPYGVFELKSFFSESIGLKSGEEISNKMIKLEVKNIIKKENKSHPLTDEEIMEFLNNQGFPVARRTVAKYRDQLKIPVARLRRQIQQ